MKIPQKTDQELKEIARDIHAGRIFCHWNLPDDGHTVGSVFIPLKLGAFEGWTEEEVKDIGLIYEYISEAGPLAVDGHPMFMSMRVLNDIDTDKVIELIQKIEAAMAAI